jgi:membrane associated rhomboid family serine protease
MYSYLEKFCDVVLQRYQGITIGNYHYHPFFTLAFTSFQIIYFIVICSFCGLDDNNHLIGPSVDTLLDFGANTQYLTRDKYQIWRVFTYMLLHGGILHLIPNVVVQLIYGWYIESIWGPWLTASIFILSGIGGGIYTASFETGIASVGSSGGITALIGFAIVESIIMKRYLRYPKFQFRLHFIYWILILASGWLPSVDNFVHLFGFLFGTSLSCLFLARNLQVKWKFWSLTIFASFFTVFLLSLGLSLFFVKINCPLCCKILGTYNCI